MLNGFPQLFKDDSIKKQALKIFEDSQLQFKIDSYYILEGDVTD